MDVPAEYLGPGEHLAQRQTSEIVNNSLTREVEVISVVDPLLFFVKLREEMDSYYTLKQSLAIFYGPGGQGSCHQVPPYMLRPYSYNVVNYNGLWIRFLVFSVTFSTKTVLGMSVDFGKVLTLDMTEQSFYPLHRLFASLPPQAIHCRLFNVKPVKRKGCEMKGVEILNSMTGIDRKLGAIFVQLDREIIDTYEVVLVDITNEEQPVFIVEEMIAAGCVKMNQRKTIS
ncbi:uncharacterized protein LOC117180765 [Belonocnema kinseyi]|uniref:uncharacterized protein LOC117180765 n=1 Tax=Belonocnema kinseyi TaxID=2817044 RepID=UPI00143D734F|nr:uncharacterized protein LOC117180765 [Belonocnema kinseyi]